MLNLVRKDILVLKWYYLFVALYALFFGLLSKVSFTLIGVMPAVILLVMGASVEMRSRTMLFVGSLPVTRNQIVKAKYLSVLVFTLIGAAVTVAMILINRYALDRDDGFTGIMFVYMAAITLLYASIYLPIYFWFGAKGGQFVTFITIFLMAAAISALSNRLSEPKQVGQFGEMSSAAWGSCIMASAALIFVISAIVSMRIFRKKDLNG